jgi:uncharacterized membrane protein YgcG
VIDKCTTEVAKYKMYVYRGKDGDVMKWLSELKKVCNEHKGSRILRPREAKPILITTMVYDSDAYKELNVWHKATSAEGKKKNNKWPKEKTPDLKRVSDILTDVKAKQDNPEWFNDFYAKQALFLRFDEDDDTWKPECKEDAAVRAKVWNVVADSIAKEQWKHFPNCASEDVASLYKRMLELKAEDGQKAGDLRHKEFVELALPNTANDRVDWANFNATATELFTAFKQEVADPPEDRRIISKIQNIMRSDDRTRPLLTQILIQESTAAGKITDPDKFLELADKLYCALYKTHDKKEKALITVDLPSGNGQGSRGKDNELIRACYNEAQDGEGTCTYGKACIFSHDADLVANFRRNLAKKAAETEKSGRGGGRGRQGGRGGRGGNGSRGRGRGPFTGRCYTCSGEGHKAADCTADVDAGSAEPIVDKEVTVQAKMAMATTSFTRKELVKMLMEHSEGSSVVQEASFRLAQEHAEATIAIAGEREPRNRYANANVMMAVSENREQQQQHQHDKQYAAAVEKDMRELEHQQKVEELQQSFARENDNIKQKMQEKQQKELEKDSVDDKSEEYGDMPYLVSSSGSDFESDDQQTAEVEIIEMYEQLSNAYEITAEEERKRVVCALEEKKRMVLAFVNDQENTRHKPPKQRPRKRRPRKVHKTSTARAQQLHHEPNNKQFAKNEPCVSVDEMCMSVDEASSSSGWKSRKTKPKTNRCGSVTGGVLKFFLPVFTILSFLWAGGVTPEAFTYTAAMAVAMPAVAAMPAIAATTWEKGAIRTLIVDSGATRAMTNDFSHLSGTLKSVNIPITGVDDQKNVTMGLKGVAEGDWEIELHFKNRTTRAPLKGCSLYPTFPLI